MHCSLRALSIAFLFITSCTAWQDGSGCRPDNGDGDDDGMEPAGDTCKPGDQTCHGGAPTLDELPTKDVLPK